MNPLIIKAKILKDFMIRNGYNPVEHTVAAWLRFLQIKTGLAGYRYDLEREWLKQQGATGKTLHDLWKSYLGREGYAGNTDGFRLYFLNWTEAAPITGGMSHPGLAALWTLEA